MNIFKVAVCLFLANDLLRSIADISPNGATVGHLLVTASTGVVAVSAWFAKIELPE